MRILANDGISQAGIDTLKSNGFEVLTVNVAQEQLVNYINKHNIAALLVRSATKVQKDIIDQCPNLKLIGRGGVGMDNIDVAYAIEKGLHVINTPEATSESVAELVFAHLYGGVRFLYDSNRTMPLDGDSRFKDLKKGYSGGIELRGKTLGILGFGKVGQATAKIALGIGMNVIYHDSDLEKTTISLNFFDGQKIDFELRNSSKETLLKKSDFITLHVPKQKNYVIDKNDFEIMKDGVAIINTAIGGVLNEVALVNALETGKVSFAGLDVYESEPQPEIRILMHPDISLTPNIGSATQEAQDRIGRELANKITKLLK